MNLLTIAFLLGLLLATMPRWAIAGGSPETTLIVVNGDSAISRWVANTYSSLRDVPPSHLIRLHDVPSLGRVDVDTFREHIWRPIQKFLVENRLEDVIDTIAYSTDFPYAVDVSNDIKTNRLGDDRYRGRIASLTGVTYFARRVESGNVGYMGPGANLYFRHNLGERRRSRPLTREETNLERKAERALGRRDFETSIALYRSLTSTRPDIGRAWHNLARALATQGRRDEAWIALQKAVESGWASSLVTRNDRYLQTLRRHPGFESLLGRMEDHNGPFEAAQGFRSRYSWERWALPSVDSQFVPLNRYYLSVLLAYTGVRGNSVPEVIKYLRTATASDGSRPDGTVYLLVNRDIRSRVRQRFFPETVRALSQRGSRAQILTRGKNARDGILPVAKDDVIGAVVGAEKFDWRKSGSRFLPGAIAESLTSYGGHFDRGSQTKLSEFLRYGAAGSSGTVAEPYSIQAKFPVPVMHVHYADGVSLAEAFYQSVSSPYQLIVVGDPLARPYARFATVSIAEPDTNTPWRGTVTIRPSVKAAPQRPIDHLEAWLDGVWIAEAPAGQPIVWNTVGVDDGSHELRLVAVEAGSIATRSYGKFQIVIDNEHRRLHVQPNSETASLGDRFTFSGTAPDAVRVALMSGFETLDVTSVEKGSWQLQADSALLGLGESVVHVRATYPDGSGARSSPIALKVIKPRPQPPFVAASAPRAGLRALLTTRDGAEYGVVLKSLGGRLPELPKGVSRIKTLHLEGYFHISKAGFYQLTANSRGRLAIEINGRRQGTWLLDRKQREIHVPLALEPGWHRLVLNLEPEGDTRLKLVLSGSQTARVLSGDLLSH